MNNQKERIMDLMRKGIITESEAIELLEKAGLETDPTETDQGSKKVDENGYQTDSSEAVKQFVNQAGSLVKSLFQSAKKSVDNNVDFSNGFPSLKYVSKSDYKAFDGDITALRVSATSGDVTLLTKDIEKTIVEVSYKIYGGVTEADVSDFIQDNVVMQLENGELIVDVKSKRIVADITITLADHELADAKFELVNGDLVIKDLEATNLEAKKTNGELKILGGHFEAITVKAVNGEVRLVTDFEKADISSVNGEILVTATAMATENLKIKNVNGDVKISVPSNIGVVGYIKTTFGTYKTRIDLDNPLEITKNGAALIRTATNSLTLDVATNSGTIWLKDGDAAPQKAARPVTPEENEPSPVAETEQEQATTDDSERS